MSRNINVNPDHYKVAGRERQGEAVLQNAQRQAYAEQRAALERWQTRRHEDAPGWETPAQPLGPPKPATKRRTRKSSASKRRRPARTTARGGSSAKARARGGTRRPATRAANAARTKTRSRAKRRRSSARRAR